ncbi:oxysterol-binding protein-related protein 11 isoform X1 [Rhynchophorus ferrugineus]|uniref:oxysterol-binding protein-related protein 11 isoform X1 n=1 Tax=Rhynchophorus ferrugineus TaxID=354439 RepID=UPI003FCE7EE5
MIHNKNIESAMDLHTKQRQFSGQLYKYTNVVKGWQYRYFLVDANAGLLHYYLCEGEKPEGNVPRGSLHLAGAVICPSHYHTVNGCPWVQCPFCYSEEDSRTFTVSCASGDMLKLRAVDAKARQEWVNGLRAVAESHTKSITANSPPLQPKEHLAVLDALSCVRSQLHQTEQADTALCRAIESSGNKFFIDPNLLLLKATSAASLHCLNQCLNILQRNQHAQQSRTGLVIDDD